MVPVLSRRQFVKKLIATSGVAGVFPGVGAIIGSPMSLPTLYTSIPAGFPVLGSIIERSFFKNGLSPATFSSYVPHPNEILSLEFLQDNRSISVLSTIGSFLTANDPRLAMIENVPVVGKSGRHVMKWLESGGEKYWGLCANDWGYHVLPAVLISNTTTGWLNSDADTFDYTEIKHKTRGLLEQFLVSKGAEASYDEIDKLFVNEASGGSSASLIQMLNPSLDTIWEPRMQSRLSMDSDATAQTGALLLGLMVPNKLWEEMSCSQKDHLSGICRKSLNATFKATNQKAQPFGATSKHFLLEEFSEFSNQIISSETGGVSNKKLKQLFG